ncbi:MAG: hypothetical protein OXI56_10880 [bacterium]|nr:hypothetical protein [bacterium]MDE0602284.1 hypothetical protein [bacterium]
MDIASQYRWEAYKSVEYYNTMHRRYKRWHFMMNMAIGGLGLGIGILTTAEEPDQQVIVIVAVMIVSLTGWNAAAGFTEKAAILSGIADSFWSVWMLCMQPDITDEALTQAFQAALARTSNSPVPIHPKILDKVDKEAREKYPRQLKAVG